MHTTRHFPRLPMRPIIPLLAVLLAAGAGVFSGCSKSPEDHARIARTHASAEKRAASVEALAAANNQALLADVAARAAHADTRSAAADKLTAEPLLADVVKNTRDTVLAIKLIGRMTTPHLLGGIAKTSRTSQIAAAAVEKISDAQTLAMLARDAALPAVRTAAVQALGDQAALAEIARGRATADIRKIAIEKLTDQAALADVAQSNSTADIRKLAVEKLTDQQALAGIVKSAAAAGIRAAAAGRLTDQELLAGIVRNEDENPAIRAAAAGRLDDQQTLAAIAKSSKNALQLRLAAAGALTDQALLAGVIKGVDDDDPGGAMQEVQTACVKKLTDQEKLATLAQDMGILFIRDIIVEKLTGQKLLSELAKNDADPGVRRAAVGKLADQGLLVEIAKTDDDEGVREQALSRLDARDAQLLRAEIVRDGKSIEAALGALEKLTDQSLLAGVAAATAHRIVREEAFAKITDAQALAALARAHEGDNAPGIRLLAVSRLADRSLLATIAANDSDSLVRKVAANMLSAAPTAAAASTTTPAATTTPAPAAAAPRGNVLDLLDEGKILAAVRGRGIARVDVRLKKTVPGPLEVDIPAGTYFTCDNAAAQNMVATEDVRVTLGQGFVERSATVPAACANHSLKEPGGHDSSVITRLPEGDALARLMPLMAGKNVSSHTKQAAVWIVTDDASYSGLDTLRSASQYAVRIPGVAYGTRAINEPEAAGAMRLCAAAGIDIKARRIWGDCAQILAGLEPGELKNWMKTFTGLAVPAHKGAVTALLVSPGAKLLVSGDADGEIKLWSLPGGEFVRTLGRHSGSVDCVAISPDGKLLATGEFGHLHLWSLADGKLLKSIDIQTEQVFENTPVNMLESVTAIAISPDAKLLALSVASGETRLWSLPGGEPAGTLKTKSIRAAFSPDGKLLATGGDEKTITLWSLPDRAPLATLEGHGASVTLVAISSDGKRLVSGDRDNVMKVWSLPGGALVGTLESHRAWNAAISPDGELLASVEARKSRQPRPVAPGMTLWRLPEGGAAARLPEAADTTCSAIAPGNELLVTGDDRRNIKLWSLPDGKLLKTLESE